MGDDLLQFLRGLAADYEPATLASARGGLFDALDDAA